jgi:hypothetical protein
VKNWSGGASFYRVEEVGKVRERGEEGDMVSMVVVTKGMAWPWHGSSMHFSWSMRAMQA